MENPYRDIIYEPHTEVTLYRRNFFSILKRKALKLYVRYRRVFEPRPQKLSCKNCRHRFTIRKYTNETGFIISGPCPDCGVVNEFMMIIPHFYLNARFDGGCR